MPYDKWFNKNTRTNQSIFLISKTKLNPKNIKRNIKII